MTGTRREFILTGITAAGAAAIPATWSPTWRAAIVGLGRSGMRYLATGLLPGVRIESICDINPHALDSALRTWREISWQAPQTHSEYRRILDDQNVDMVICA